MRYNVKINNEAIEIRPLKSEDSISELTQVLNESYKFLLDMGLNYVAATQNDEVTLIRVNKAYKCFVAIREGKIIGTVSLYNYSPSTNSEWYNQKHVAKIGQFAVLPEYQKHGLGGKLMDIAELEASCLEHITEVALDTAETAYHLIRYYEKRKYRYVETIRWGLANYKSSVMSKVLKQK
ncbi:MAG: GNAT family N-acetyltransferase [Clostridia bacterium]|nr:GNAT family N-acetyltransferase [Clostridia bacterium]